MSLDEICALPVSHLATDAAMLFLWTTAPHLQESSQALASVITAPRREHSRKPDEAYEMIERMYPELPKIELFARNARPSWAAWGNQVTTAA
jgi:N6-adenosine-specific RNA methylase IME4